MMKHIIKEVKAGSIGEELGLEPGDCLASIDGQPIEDVLDYYYLSSGDYMVLQIVTKDGQQVDCEVEKEADEDMGLVFEDSFMGTYQHCQNRCVFCFIDQLPKGMRSTLYFKDDDSRLSFINGNYITMTNMQEADFEKIIAYQLSPINVSIHTTDPQLRVTMLKNPKAAKIMEQLQRLAEAGIVLNGQIVLCKGLNDGKALDRTLQDLQKLRPQLQSVSIVPVGLSRHREGLYPLEPFSKEDCAAAIRQVEAYQQRFYEEDGMHFVHLSDEFYLKAEQELPQEERYDGYLQIENGVGMMRLFLDEAEEELARQKLAAWQERPGREISVVTATGAEAYIRAICRQVEELAPSVRIHVYAIVNHFFGEDITVTGLLTGQDILQQLQGKELGSQLLLPENLLMAGEERLLDDVTIDDMKKALQIPISVVKSSGKDFVIGLLGEEPGCKPC